SKKNFKLSQRDECLSALIGMLAEKAPAINVDIKVLGLNAAATLINLEPPLNNAMRLKLLEVVLPYYSFDREDRERTMSAVSNQTPGSPKINPLSPSSSPSSSSSSDAND